MKSVKKKSAPRPKVPGNVKLARSGVHGYGLFAKEYIPKNTRIIEYLGEKITKAVAWQREQDRLAEQAAGRDGCVYIFDLNKRHDIDGGVSWNLAKRINHSCGPNCHVESNRSRIWVVAARDIAPGEELTFDYGFSYADWREHPCRCGAEECIGFIVNIGQRWRVRKILADEKQAKRAAKAK